jgi:putative Mn2+ efflux pump MntP
VTAALAAAGASGRDLAAATAAFGIAQAAMAAAGAAGGAWLTASAAAWDHWIAFGLLLVVGGQMLRGDGDGEGAAPTDGRLAPAVLVGLAVATSIDALAAGVSLPLLGPPAALSVAFIGGVTAALCGLAVWAGRSAGALIGPWATRAAGVVLIGLGLRILLAELLGLG